MLYDMKKLHKIIVMALLSVALLFVPLQGNRGLRAQGLPTIDLSNLATAIMNWLQDQDVAGLFETVSGKAIDVEEWAEKTAQITTLISYANQVVQMANSGIGIFNTLTDVYNQTSTFINYLNYFRQKNAPQFIISTAYFITCDFTDVVKNIVGDIEGTLTRYGAMGLGNAITALKMAEDLCNNIRDNLMQAVAYYRARIAEVMSVYMSIERATSNFAYISTFFY